MAEKNKDFVLSCSFVLAEALREIFRHGQLWNSDLFEEICSQLRDCREEGIKLHFLNDKRGKEQLAKIQRAINKVMRDALQASDEVANLLLGSQEEKGGYEDD